MREHHPFCFQDPQDHQGLEERRETLYGFGFHGVQDVVSVFVRHEQ